MKQQFLKHNFILILFVFILINPNNSVGGSVIEDKDADKEHYRTRANIKKRFAIGVLRLSDQVVYYNDKAVVQYSLDHNYNMPSSWGYFSEENKSKIIPYIGKLVVLKGYQRSYPTWGLKKLNGDDAFRVAKPTISIFEITDIIPVTLLQDNDILSVKAPAVFTDKTSNFLFNINNPIHSPLEFGLLTIYITGKSHPKNLEIEGWKKASLYSLSPERKRIQVLLEPNESKVFGFAIRKKEKDIILERVDSKSSVSRIVNINISFIGYWKHLGKDKVIMSSLKTNYEEKYIGQFEFSPEGSPYGGILHTTFGRFMVGKLGIKRYGDVSLFDDRVIIISGFIDGYPPVISSIDSIELKQD